MSNFLVSIIHLTNFTISLCRKGKDQSIIAKLIDKLNKEDDFLMGMRKFIREKLSE
jgi:hypothetical protein